MEVLMTTKCAVLFFIMFSQIRTLSIASLTYKTTKNNLESCLESKDPILTWGILYMDKKSLLDSQDLVSCTKLHCEGNIKPLNNVC